MTVLPIVERELRVASRQWATYWVRLGLAVGVIFVVAVLFVLTFGLSPQQTGRRIFTWSAGILMLYCLAYGRRATADCLSQEKREGTLGLLFLTDLKGHDVVLGKLVATSVRGFYGLLAVFPVLAIPLLLGGVSSGEFWRMVLVLTATFLFSLAIGMLGSALTRDLRRAMAANQILLLLLMAAPPACMAALGYFAPRLRPMPQLLYSCPAFPFFLCDDTQYRSAGDQYWWSLAVIHSLTWLLLLIAAWIVPRSWQDAPARAEPARVTALWHAWRHGPVAGKGAFRRQALHVNAFYWLAARARFKPVHVWTFLACMAAWWLLGWLFSGNLWLDLPGAVVTGLLLNSALKVWLTIEAGQQLADDQSSGAFELLLSTPLTVRDILRGQRLALRRQFLGPLLAVLGVELCLMLAVRRSRADWQFQGVWLAGMFMLVVDLATLSWVAMGRALVARSHNFATIGTLARVLVLPWALFGAVAGVGNVWCGLSLGKEWDPGWQFFLYLWLGLGLAADLVFGLTAWWQLRTRFRELALRRFNPAPSRFARWFGLEKTSGPLPRRGGVAIQTSRLNKPQRRDERKEHLGKGISALIASLRLKLPAGSLRSRLALASCLSLVIIGLGFLLLRPRVHWPPPMIVSLSQSNGPVQVTFGGSGVVLVLPDGSLWRWGKTASPALPWAPVPEQVGTNRDWVQAAAGYSHLVAVRRDGTLWEWRLGAGNAGGNAASSPELRPLDSNHRWLSIATMGPHSVALRSDGTVWAWGDNTLGQLGIGPGPSQTNLVQVGTNRDWVAVCCQWNSTLALRRDGTLWAWGPIYVLGSSRVTLNNVATPARVCLESNWTGFIGGSLPLVRNRAGELWEPFHAPPNGEAPAAASLRLVITNAVPGRFATVWCGGPEICEVRSDGTLWERTQPLTTFSRVPVGKWRRMGKRSDWTALWGGAGTAFGLTADGTLWTWGVDPSQTRAPDFMTRLKQAQRRLTTLLSPTPRPVTAGVAPVYLAQPRPLLRLVLTGSTPAASTANPNGR